MQVKTLRKMLDLFENEEAEVVIVDDTSGPIGNIWEGGYREISLLRRKYIEKNGSLIANRPCVETKNAKEAIVIYVKQ